MTENERALLKAAMAVADAREPFKYTGRVLRCRYCDIKAPDHHPECVQRKYLEARASIHPQEGRKPRE